MAGRERLGELTGGGALLATGTCVLLTAAACATHPTPSHTHSAASSASAPALTPPGGEVLARARSAFRSAASVTVNVESKVMGDSAPPFDHWTETVTAHGKTTDQPFTGSLKDPITCSSLTTCADYYLNPENYKLDVSTVGAGDRREFTVYAETSADPTMGFPGWIATIDAKTYAPITVVNGWSCTHCFYLTYDFRLTPRRYPSHPVGR